MQLTTIDQLKEVKPGDILFLINCFGRRDQSKVEVQKFLVGEVKEHFYKGCSPSQISEALWDSEQRFTDLLMDCKYVYTELGEAESMLRNVRAGLHADGDYLGDWRKEYQLKSVQRAATKPSIMNRLKSEQVVSFKPQSDGTFRVKEKCDDNFMEYLTRDEMLQLAREIIDMSQTNKT
jgi:hypothetical protein